MDAEMVELFGSEHFSQLQAEMSSLGFRLKKQMDEQMENTLSNLPIVTRTEMDSMYKSMYEMNKELRNLLRENATTVTATAKKASATVKKAAKATVKKTTKPTAKKATAKKATAKKAAPKAKAKKATAKKTTRKK
jgi:topoisomerase IA-like protein